ncbi:MAG: uridine kinase [Lachnospiraceae bacterium]|nr:uridine kinase [Lachnospiraceae bacterium]
MEHIIIGIAGGSGSGKTTLARNIKETFSDDAVLISMDSYYKHSPELTYEERVVRNYDHPDAFDLDMFIDHVRALKQGRTIVVPQYDFTAHLRSDQTVTVESRSIIILEGVLLFADPRLTELMDIKVFVDTDADVRIIRRIVRDVKKRGRSLDSVVAQYLGTVKPMHEQFVEPGKKIADIIVPEGGKNLVALGMISDFLEKKIKNQKETE